MGSAYKCDGCGEFNEGASPVKADFRVWVTADNGEGKKDALVQQYCSLQCFFETDKEEMVEDLMIEVDESDVDE